MGGERGEGGLAEVYKVLVMGLVDGVRMLREMNVSLLARKME